MRDKYKVPINVDSLEFLYRVWKKQDRKPYCKTAAAEGYIMAISDISKIIADCRHKEESSDVIVKKIIEHIDNIQTQD